MFLIWCYLKQLFTSFRKFKKDYNVLKVILVQGFCSLKTEVARFSIGFRLNCLCFHEMNTDWLVPVAPQQPSPARTDSAAQNPLTERSFKQNEKSRFLRMTQNPTATEPEKSMKTINRPALIDFNFFFLQKVNRI